MNVHGWDVETRWINDTKYQWAIVEKKAPEFILHEARIKNQPIPFETGESHEKQIDDVHRVMKAVP